MHPARIVVNALLSLGNRDAIDEVHETRSRIRYERWIEKHPDEAYIPF